MGLDIYLYRCKDLKGYKKQEKKQELEKEAVWDQFGKIKYENLTESQKEKCRKDSKAIDEKYSGKGFIQEESIEIDSKKHPEHMFKVGYFRSSYNDGGINNVLRNEGLKCLYDIFGRGREEDYCWAPDWEESLANAKQVLSQLKEIKDRKYAVTKVDLGAIGLRENIVSSEFEALKVFEKNVESHKTSKGGFNWYSSSEGHFFLGEPPKLLAAIQGKCDFIRSQVPCVYLVYETKNPHLKWYYEAIEIVIETIEYVLKQDKPNEFYFHWSG